jgi:hypothetical protein
MSGGTVCTCIPRDRAKWEVLQRRCNHSAFNGYRQTWSRYSSVRCTICGRCWRTMGAYVDDLPDQHEGKAA